MKIEIEVKVQGALSGQQADAVLMFTKGVSAKNTACLDEMDDPNPVDHASLCMFRSSYNGKYIVAHWQTGFETFPQNGRYYCTRAIYEMPSGKVEKSDYESLFESLPRLEKFTVKKFDADPVLVEVEENKVSQANDDILKYIWIAIAAGKRLFIRLDSSEDCYANSLLSSTRFRRLLGALNALPMSIRRTASFGYSLKAADAAKNNNSVFAGLWIVAYYPESSLVLPDDCVVVNWTGQSLTAVDDCSKYECLAEELKSVSNIINDDYEDWKTMCAAVIQAKSSIDEALKIQNYPVLKAAFEKSCAYRKRDILQSLINRVARLASPSAEEVKFLYQNSAKGENMDKLLIKWLKSTKVASESKREIYNLCSDRQVVIDALRDISRALSLREKFAGFGSDLCNLSYSDLVLDRAPDSEFLEIYKGLLSGIYKNVDVKKVPGSGLFPMRYAKLAIARNQDAIIDDKKFKSVVKDHKLVDETFLDWLFSKKYIKTPEQLVAWAAWVDNALLSGLVAKYVEVNSSSLTCVDLLKLKDSKLAFAYEEHLAGNKLPLGDIVAFCHDRSTELKDAAYVLMAGREITTLQEWEQMRDAFGKSGAELKDGFFAGQKPGSLNLKSLLMIYTKYQKHNDVREYVEKTVLSLAEKRLGDKEIKDALAAMGKVNSDFRRRIQQASKAKVQGFMLSPTGAKVAWGLSTAFFVVIIFLSSMMGRFRISDDEPTSSAEFTDSTKHQQVASLSQSSDTVTVVDTDNVNNPQ